MGLASSNCGTAGSSATDPDVLAGCLPASGIGSTVGTPEDGDRPTASPALVAESPLMKGVIDLITRVGPSQAHVLISGEYGTGRAAVARALHAASTRSSNELVAMSVAGSPAVVLERELFGHVEEAPARARAGRVSLAHGGTLFLDDIASLPASLQPRLLRLVESGEFEPAGSSETRRADVRVISATTVSLGAEVAAGRFRQDLLFRLNTVEIALAPLRNRREDILPLARQFLKRHTQRYRKAIDGFGAAAADALVAHAWPGNIRELDHAVERGVLMASGRAITAADLALPSGRETPLPLDDMSLDQVEELLIKKALARFDGNVSQTARALGLSRSALYRRLQRHGL